MLNPQIMEHILACYSCARIDLFTSRENTKCELFFSLCTLDAPLGVDALAHTWLRELLYVFLPLALITRRSSTLASIALAGRDISDAVHPALTVAGVQALALEKGGMVFYLLPERLQLWAPIECG